MNTETKTLTVQEFALYIGQLVEYPDTDGTPMQARLTGVSKTDGIETTYLKRKAGEPNGDYLAFRSNGNHNSDALHAKLILRPISDMTAEELIESGEITAPGNNTPKDIIQEALLSVKNKGIKAFDFSELKPEQVFAFTAFLLSRGFDLFNWIEQGKAIRKV